MRKILLTGCAIAALISSAHAQTFSLRDASKIVDDSRHNEVRFNRDYKGQTFSDVVSFKSISEGWFGHWHLSFDGAYCFIDADTAKSLVDWDRGKKLRLTGTIETTMFGDIELENCKFGEHGTGPITAAPEEAPNKSGAGEGKPGQELVCPVTADGRHDVCYWRDAH